MNPMVTTNQKPNRDTQKLKRKELLKKIIKAQGKKQKEEEMNREELQKQPENK